MVDFVEGPSPLSCGVVEGRRQIGNIWKSLSGGGWRWVCNGHRAQRANSLEDAKAAVVRSLDFDKSGSHNPMRQGAR